MLEPPLNSTFGHCSLKYITSIFIQFKVNTKAYGRFSYINIAGRWLATDGAPFFWGVHKYISHRKDLGESPLTYWNWEPNWVDIYSKELAYSDMATPPKTCITKQFHVIPTAKGVLSIDPLCIYDQKTWLCIWNLVSSISSIDRPHSIHKNRCVQVYRRLDYTRKREKRKGERSSHHGPSFWLLFLACFLRPVAQITGKLKLLRYGGKLV